MGTLYEINRELLQVMQIMEEEGFDYADTLEGLKLEFDEKVDNVACYIKELRSQVEAISAEEKALNARKKSKENQINNLAVYLQDALEIQNMKRFESARNVLSIRKTPPSVQVKDEDDFVKWAQDSEFENDLIKYKVDISKTAIKNLIKRGVDVPGVEIVQSERLNIK